MSIDSTWLRCPNCFSDLSPVDERVYGCARGHRFDRSKHGYLTLLDPKAPRTVGDDHEMLAARAALLGRGVYLPIAQELLRTALPAGEGHPGAPPRIADLGCGTGYYAAHLSDAHADATFLLADRSPQAVRSALRSLPGATGVVLDIWRPLPLRTHVADVILNVFAPRNPSEFARILRPGGRLAVVIPQADHLHELRELGMLLGILPAKASVVTTQLGGAGFEARDARRLRYAIQADSETRALLAEMGPSAHHAATRVDADVEGTIDVTIAVEVITFELASPPR
jgi:23S rRNA (guanine745-N1)-methyltransferase